MTNSIEEGGRRRDGMRMHASKSRLPPGQPQQAKLVWGGLRPGFLVHSFIRSFVP